ncbi:fibrinogen gamma chain [Amphiprion ocellaris]|uniref:Fibrinogen C-terminal domain-containing protein n=1 Tax=Amphiprion ocellaris TaxID=80972 RepID=A0A3Q1DEZ4_AMPOC|nr:fibrinogen gamma chain [Amphiprion ocellaris]
MAPSLLAAAGGLVLLFSFSSAQIRGDNVATCNPNDGFGKYCPTTCGVADYLLRYMPGVENDLDDMQSQLETIANLTQGAESTITYMKDSTTSAQKSAQPDPYFKKSTNMLDDVLRFEKTIIAQEQQIFELQNLLASNERRMADLKQLSIQLQQKCNEPCKDTVEIQTTTGTDCQDIANKGATTSGLYYVRPEKATEQFLVYCEIDSFGRGFTVIQRRRDGSVDFHKDWIQYKEGFGYLSPDDTTEFWLGNEKIHLLTATSSTIPTVLRIELVDWDGNKRYADYNMFRIGSEADMYRLTYGFYFGGDAGDAFSGFDFGDDPSDKFYTSHNGMQFSTFDKDNDKYDGNCALQDGSGWWMNRCHAAHLNGKYYQGGRYTEKDAGEFGYDNGIIWVTWHNRWYSLKETTMKIIPLSRLTAGGGQQAGVKQFGGLGS